MKINTGQWTNEEDEFLRNNIDHMSGQEIANALNRTRRSVYNRAQVLFLSFNKKAIYQLYEKDMPVFSGTVEECAEFWGVEISTIQFYATKTYAKRVEESGRPENRRIVVRL